MVVAAIIPVLFAGTGAVDLTGWVGTVATYGFMLAYALVSLAAPVFLSRVGVLNPVVWVVGAIGLLSMAFVFWANWLTRLIPGGLFPALSGVYFWLPYVFLAWVAVGLVWYFIARARNPELVLQVGRRFETETETVA
jgi:hypothetical protein